MLAGGCHYAGPLAGGASEIREGGLPDRVSRFLAEGGGARTVDELLPASVGDSAAIYLVVVDQRALGIGNAQVAILPHTMSTPSLPKEGWHPVDAHGVYTKRFTPGEYFVFVQDPFHWTAKKLVRLRAGAVDTLLAVMRSGVGQGDRAFQPFPH
jgi:hypothetical protein